ncbi:MAG: preprotein translocase subunit SecG [Deltaproteobacteria bacterium]|nr:preprotein translocase subunit SecG [Deltaproteobacteria bacterium]
MTTAITTIHIVVAFILMISVLLQSGKGSGLGAAFGGGSSSVFGSRGPATLISRVTSVAAIIFMVTSLTLSIFAQGGGPTGSVVTEDEIPEVQAQTEGKPIDEEALQLPAGSTLDQEGAPAQETNAQETKLDQDAKAQDAAASGHDHARAPDSAATSDPAALGAPARSDNSSPAASNPTEASGGNEAPAAGQDPDIDSSLSSTNPAHASKDPDSSQAENSSQANDAK